MRWRVSVLAAASLGLHAQQTMHLTLGEAQRLAAQNNPEISAARYTAAAAYQIPNEYRSTYQPNLFGSFTSVGADNGSRLAAGGLNNPVVYDRVGSGLSVSQLITDFGRTGSLVGAAKLRAQAQDQVTERSRAQTLLDASRAYFSVLRAQAVLKVANQTVDARQLVVDQVSALAQSKLKSTLDVSFAKVNLSDAKLLQIRAQSDVKAAEAELSRAMGLPGEADFVLAEEPMPAALPDRVGDLIGQALQNRPELRELRLRESADQRFARAEHALNYPDPGGRRNRRVGARRLRDRPRALRRHRPECYDSDLQRRAVQSPPDASRVDRKSGPFGPDRHAEPRGPRCARGLAERQHGV